MATHDNEKDNSLNRKSTENTGEITLMRDILEKLVRLDRIVSKLEALKIEYQHWKITAKQQRT